MQTDSSFDAHDGISKKRTVWPAFFICKTDTAKATSTFKGVTDGDSATAALPDIDKLTESFGGFSDMFGKLSDVAKTAVIELFTSALGDLKPILDKVLAIPGVESILKPAIDAMLAKIGSFKA